MLLSAYLAIACAQLPVDARAGENPLTTLNLKVAGQGQAFDWSDADESLRGGVTPAPARAGEPLTVSAALQPLQGPDLDVPLTIGLRPLEALGSVQSQTVSRAKDDADGGAGQRGWVATFTPEEPGDYRLEISWRSTHHKVVRGVVTVAPRGLPRWTTWAAGSALIVAALGVGLWILFGRQESASS
jgi:hypothetical protein